MRRCMRGDRRMEGMHWMRNNVIYLRWRLWLRRRISMRMGTCRSLMVKRSGQRSICNEKNQQLLSLSKAVSGLNL